MEKTYFIYRYVRHDKNVPFYIGVGTKNFNNSQGYPNYSEKSIYLRAYSKDRNIACSKIMSKTTYDVEILYESTDFNHIQEKEKEFISLYGIVYDKTGTLVNLTMGGVAFKTTEEYLKKHKRSCKRKGVVFGNKRRQVSMYDLKGNYIESFCSLLDFYKKYPYVEKTGYRLSKAAKTRTPYMGYLFSFERLDRLDVSKYKTSDLRIQYPIVEYKKGVPINIYTSSLKAAKAAGISPTEMGRTIESGKVVNNSVFKKEQLHNLIKLKIQCN